MSFCCQGSERIWRQGGWPYDPRFRLRRARFRAVGWIVLGDRRRRVEVRRQRSARIWRQGGWPPTFNLRRAQFRALDLEVLRDRQRRLEFRRQRSLRIWG